MYDIHKAKTVFSSDPKYNNVYNYLPIILATKDLVREHVLEFEADTQSPRSLSLTVTPDYVPLSDLVHHGQWQNFCTAFLDLIYCHVMLWLEGIQHRDIHLDNLMWDPISQNAKLCDFHVSPSDDVPIDYHETLSATQLFVTEDLLPVPCERPDGVKPRRPLYRHDLESFLYCLAHIILETADEDGAEALTSWTQDTTGLGQMRKQTVRCLRDYKPGENINATDLGFWQACGGFVVYVLLLLGLETDGMFQFMDREEYIQSALASNTPRMLRKFIPGKDSPNPEYGEDNGWGWGWAVGPQKMFEKWDKADLLLQKLSNVSDQALIASESLEVDFNYLSELRDKHFPPNSYTYTYSMVNP